MIFQSESTKAEPNDLSGQTLTTDSLHELCITQGSQTGSDTDCTHDKVITLLHETHETDSMEIYLSRHTKQIPWRYIYLPVINVLGLGLNLWIFSISLTQ